MKKKRLDRGLNWGFQHYPYYQMRIDLPEFHGMASMIKLINGDYCYWDLPKAGKTPVCGKGMTWLQLIPDHAHRVITTKFLTLKDDERVPSVSIWYVDVINDFGYDPDGVLYFIDEYLDVVFNLHGDVIIDDRDELDAAYESGELSMKQYEMAIKEGDTIKEELCSDIEATEKWCQKILMYMEQQIEGNKDMLVRNV